MSFEEIYYLSSIAGVIVLFASMLFVGFQIRQNTKMLRAQIHQQVTDSYITLSMSSANSPGRIVSGGMFAEMTDDEIEKFSARMIGMFKHFENIFFQNKEGFVSDQYWETHLNHMRNIYHRPAIKVWWNVRKDIFATDFRNFVDCCAPPPPTTSLQTEIRRLQDDNTATGS